MVYIVGNRTERTTDLNVCRQPVAMPPSNQLWWRDYLTTLLNEQHPQVTATYP